ncbi:MKI67 FHA domain-interacting nucleolar phosphoprotein-like [Mizuhopecten yessoensis]|uniref:MKI67 FHA domain-interacting nucleolar phosphoprotein-like n=1 Tax=Mizuhopecten yessoensis TaxID=6573 RepID=A0A210Q1K6_MIZYE|nr:MKI67 FHA domain-interacting nucleolar phosphoprotein-like [Mizuhopecten yessoensis]OWF42630.1 MKI67 FHA domain-interacting nucleolar phosphoprotein-like [Mizuhopecten yessoensis]
MAASIEKRGPEENNFKMPPNVSLETDQQIEFEKKVKNIKAKKNSDAPKGVVYLGHIPVGFHEPQMRGFFSQFGTVTRLKLCRSLKTGRSKGFAFIEFLYEDVAKVVAETMNNYLLFERLLKCEFVPSEKVNEGTFRVVNRRIVPFKTREKNTFVHNKTKKDKIQLRNMKNFISKNEKKMEKLKALGVEFSYAGMDELKEETAKLGEKVKINREIVEDKQAIAEEFKRRKQEAKAKRFSKVKARREAWLAEKKEDQKLVSEEFRQRNQDASPKKAVKTTTKKAVKKQPKMDGKSEQKETVKSNAEMALKSESKKAVKSDSNTAVKLTAKNAPKPPSIKSVKSEPKKAMKVGPKKADKSLLVDDSEEEEISFKTPPNTRRTSKRKLAKSLPAKSTLARKDTEVSTSVTTPKRQKRTVTSQAKSVTRPASATKTRKSLR